MTRSYKHTWQADPSMDEMLRALWDSGQSATVIARVMSRAFYPMSRNAILGRVHRTGLPPRKERGERSYPETRKPPTAFVAPPEPEPEPIAMPEPETAPIRLLDAGPNQCRWIVDLSPEPTVCGKPGRTWCEVHRKTVYPPQPKKREQVAA